LTSDLAKVFFGEMGYKLTSVLLFISVLTFVNSAMLTNPRVYFAMAEDGVLPKVFKKMNDQTQVQGFALSVFAVFLILVLLFIDSFKELLNYVMFFDSIGMITSAFTVYLLRKQINNQSSGQQLYQIGFGKNILPALFIITYFTVALSALLDSPQNIPYSLGLFLGGFPLYWLIKKANL
jgi:APA family basic amino acid/polyamine antiporter